MNKIKKFFKKIQYSFEEHGEVTITLYYKYDRADGNSEQGREFHEFTVISNSSWAYPSKYLTEQLKNKIGKQLTEEYNKVKKLTKLTVNNSVIDVNHIVAVTYDWTVKLKSLSFEEWLKYKDY